MEARAAATSGAHPRRGLVWAVLVALPLAGFVLLLAQPGLDVHWEHHPAHFWLVVAVAVVNAALALVMNEAARKREDGRVFLLSLVFVSSASFLALHALATPDVLLEGGNAGFVLASAVGLLVAGVFAAASSLELTPPQSARLVRRAGAIRGALLALIGVWAVVSLAGLPPLADPLPPDEARLPLGLLSAAGGLLYALAAFRYSRLYAVRPTLLVAAVITSCVLLAEATLAVAFSRNWRATWWEWHALMLASFALVAWATRAEYRRTGSLTGAVGGLFLESTIARLDQRYADALKDLVEDGEGGEVRERYGLSADEAGSLDRAARWIREAGATPPVSESIAEGDCEVSVLFADLQGFTSFSERAEPSEVLEMLNANFEVVVPILTGHGARIDKFVGDAVMAEFNLGGEPQPDHALRAAQAGLAMQDATERTARSRPGWPRFRVGINTGPVRVGRVGGQDLTVIGDTVNLASRLEGKAEAGQVVIGAATLHAIGDRAEVDDLGELPVKGKDVPVRAFVLRAVRSG